MHIRLLGGFAVEMDGVAVESRRWRLRHARTLVAMLALAQGQRLARDAVIDRLWPEVDLSVGTHNLHQVMYVARLALAARAGHADDVDVLSIKDGQVVLAVGRSISVDAVEFEAAALEALTSDDAVALEAAAARYAGPLLPELPDAPWAEARRSTLARGRSRTCSSGSANTAPQTGIATGVERPSSGHSPTNASTSRRSAG